MEIIPVIFVSIVVGFMLVIVCYLILTALSPKFEGKMMSRQIKSLRYMTENSKEDLEAIGKTMGNTNANIQKGILDENKETLRDVSTRQANIEKDAIEIKMNAIKKGLTGDGVYCKHCGKMIDKDSTFCKYCGKEQ